MMMNLKAPFVISSRLLPALKIGDGTLSLEYVGEVCGRSCYRWYADLPAGEFSEADLKSGMQGCTTQEMFGTLLSFLGACAEAYRYGADSDNYDLFPEAVAEWAYQHDDEISMLAYEIEESGEVLIED